MTALTRWWLQLIGRIPLPVLKTTVYSLLIINFFVYVYQDWGAAQAFLAPELPAVEILALFATSIDMVAWLALVFLFEIETSMLSRGGITRRAGWCLFGGKSLCYLAVLFAFHAYLEDTRWLHQAARLDGSASLCALADGELSFQAGLEYELVSAENCTTLTSDSILYWLEPGTLVTDASNLRAARLMAWIDVLNGAAWLLVILLLQVEVWQEAHADRAPVLVGAARRSKALLYTLLTAIALYWAARGLLLYAWDAFLWLGGFGAIDLSLSEWDRRARRHPSVRGSA